MELSYISQKRLFLISFTIGELESIQKIIATPLKLISDEEFPTRTGFTKSEAEILISTLENLKNSQDNEQEIICTIEIYRCDLLILHQSMNEVCNGLYLDDIEKQTGVNREWIKYHLALTNKELLKRVI